MDPRGRRREFYTGKTTINLASRGRLYAAATAYYSTKSKGAIVGKTGKTAVLPSTVLLAARLVLLSKTISSTIEAIFLGSQVPEGYTKNKQAAALLTCDTAQRSSVVGYPLYQSSMQ